MSPERRRHAQDGIALVSALLAVLVIGAIVSLVASNAIFETEQTADARDYETSLHTAEAGAEVVFETIMAGGASPLAWTGPLSPTVAEERAWVLAQPAPASQVETADGAGYGVGPVLRDGKLYVYGVGTAGPSDQPRVVKTEIKVAAAHPMFGGNGLLFGGDLAVTGSHNINGDAHVDGDLRLNHCGFRVQGRVTVGGSHNAANYPGKSRPETEPGGCWMPGNIEVSGNPPEQVCLSWGCHPAWRPPVQAEGPPIPDLRAIDVHRAHAAQLGAVNRWFDMCRENVPGQGIRGVVRRGAAQPCTGEIVVSLRPTDASGGNNDQWWHGQGWRYYNQGSTNNHLPNSWVKVSADGGATPAVYYMHETNFTMKAGHADREMSYIVSGSPNLPVGVSSGQPGRYSGNANLPGSVQARQVDALDGHWAVFADRDVHTLGGGGGRNIYGNIYAREQIQMLGSTITTGSVVSGDLHDDAGSPISTSDLGGSSTFTYFADFDPPDSSNSDSPLTVFAWDEL